MDPRKRSPAKNTKSTKDRRYDDVSSCRRAYEQKECGDNGCRGLRLLEEKLLLDEESLFGILIHATGTCRGTSTPAPSQRTRFALSVTQRRSRRSSSAWYAFSQSTEQFPSGRSWRGTNWTTRDSSKLFEVVYKNSKTFAFHVQVHINMPRTRFERIILMYVVLICPVLLAPSFVCGTEGMYAQVLFL